MKHISARSLSAIMLLALVTLAAGPATLLAVTKSFTFDVGTAYGDKDQFDLPKISEGGCILAQVTSWSRSGTSGSPASELALILNGSDRTGYYTRADGRAPVWISYAVSAKDVQRVATWTISVVNFTRSGTARGSITVEYPPTQLPCELKAAVSRTKGQVDVVWRYTGRAFNGSFLVERSTDGRTWSAVSACTKSPTSTNYACSEKGLTSGKTYLYRACAVASGAKQCRRENVTPATSVRVP